MFKEEQKNTYGKIIQKKDGKKATQLEEEVAAVILSLKSEKSKKPQQESLRTLMISSVTLVDYTQADGTAN
jgi:hypothetical protein